MNTANTLKPGNSKEALALWLAQNQPTVFAALVSRANRSGKLNGITDWLSNVGTTLSSSVKSVGSFLGSKEGMTTLTALGTTYLQTQAQKNALRIQTAQAQAGYGMQPIVSGPTSSQYPMYINRATGLQYPLTSSLTSQLMPASMQPYAPWLIGGFLGLLALFALKR